MAPTAGPLDAKYAIVSRSPGKADVRKKMPFGGKSGEIIQYLLNLYGVKREEVLTTNVVLCEYDGTPPREAMEACAPRLQAELSGVDTIIAAGSEAVGQLLGARSMDRIRGYVHGRAGKRIIATNNPAIVLRDDSTFPNLVRDFRLALAPLPEPTLPDVDWTNNVSEGRRWLQSIAKQDIGLLSVDIETRGLRSAASLAALGLSATGSKAISFGSKVCGDEYTRRNYIQPLVSRSATESRYLYHNGKFDIRNLRAHGINARVDEDTMLLSWALDERSDENQVHRLEYLLMNELNWPNYEPKEVVAWKARMKLLEKQMKFDEMEEVPTPDELYKYNALDAAGTALLFPILKERAIRDNVWESPYRKVLLRASDKLVTVELQGIGYDAEAACDMLEEEVWPLLQQQTEELRLIVGDGGYNPNSAPQNAKLVYDDWKILHNLPLKTERSVDKSVYTEIKAGRFLCGTFSDREAARRDTDGANGNRNQLAIVRDTALRWAEFFSDYKSLEKQRGTYFEGLIPLASYYGNRLYTDLKLHNTVTGRTSSSHPNLQNITRPKAGLPDVRSLFRPSDGRVLVSADYSQAELRTMAALSGDTELTRVYTAGIDLHSVAAERFYGVGFTKEQRSRAKNMMFGVPYGQSPETFQEKHDIPEREAAEFIEWWFSTFTGVVEWREDVAKIAQRDGEIVSPFGHKRRFHLITDQNKKAIIREAINFLPQNIAAVLTLLALCDLVDDVDLQEKAPVILTVHDSILLDADPAHLTDISNRVLGAMVAAPKKYLDWDFPFEADLEIGPSWGQLTKYQDEVAA